MTQISLHTAHAGTWVRFDPGHPTKANQVGRVGDAVDRGDLTHVTGFSKGIWVYFPGAAEVVPMFAYSMVETVGNPPLNKYGFPIPKTYYIGDVNAYALDDTIEQVLTAPINIDGTVDWDNLGPVDSRADEHLELEARIIRGALLAIRSAHTLRRHYEEMAFSSLPPHDEVV